MTITTLCPGCTGSVAIVTVSGVTKLMWFLYEAKTGAAELEREGSTPTFAYCKTMRVEVSLGRCCEAVKELLLSLQDRQCDTEKHKNVPETLTFYIPV